MVDRKYDNKKVNISTRRSTSTNTNTGNNKTRDGTATRSHKITTKGGFWGDQNKLDKMMKKHNDILKKKLKEWEIKLRIIKNKINATSESYKQLKGVGNQFEQSDQVLQSAITKGGKWGTWGTSELMLNKLTESNNTFKKDWDNTIDKVILNEVDSLNEIVNSTKNEIFKFKENLKRT